MPLYLGKSVIGNATKVVDRQGKKVLEDEYLISPTREDTESPELEQYETYKNPFTDGNGIEYDGLGNIKVRKVGSWIDSEISADNIRKGHTILGVAGQVDELLPEEISVKSSTYKKEITPSNGKTGITKVTVEPIVYEQKTVDPSKNSFNVFASTGYDALSRVTVSAVTSDVDENIKPENIKKDVNILGVTGTLEETIGEAVLEELNISPTTSAQTFKPNEGVDGYSKVNVEAVTSAIDTNIIPKNIKRGVTILGVNGDFVLENLQSKVVSPSLGTQVVTYDDDKYEGLSSVTIQPVTASIDSDIKPENIKAGVDILGVSGEYEGETYNIEPTININAKTTPIVVKPSEGYDYLSQVNIAGVTASIDPNILAENIRKNITILGVTGNLEEQKYYFKDSVRVIAGTNDVVVKPGDGYDALLEVIVEAVNASIDPNILPKNIKKNVSILGVTGTLEEGDKQKWFDFEGSQGVAPLGNVVMGGGSEWHTEEQLIKNEDELFDDWFENKQGAISNIGAALFSIVNGYDDEVATNPWLSQTFIYFQGGSYYKDYSTFVKIPDRVCHLYAFDNEFGVDGCLLNSEDSSEEKTYNMYLLNGTEPRVVLVDGTMSESLLPEGYDNYIYIREITIPSHKVFVPRYDSNKFRLNWVLRDEKNITHNSQENGTIMPVTINISASDINYGEDEELEIINEEHINYTTTSTAPTITDGIVSSFGSSKYVIYEPQVGNVDYLEVTCRAYVVGGGTYNVFFNDENKGFGVYGSTSERYWRIWSGGGNYSPLYNFTNNNWYWCKLIQENNTTKLLTMLDDGTYEKIYELPQKNSNKWKTSISLNFKLFSTMNRLYIGNGYNTTSEYWRGNIDLNNFEFNINNQKYYPYQKIVEVKSNHNITPLSENLLFYVGEGGLWNGDGYDIKQGSLYNYEDDGSAVEMPVYIIKRINDNEIKLEYALSLDDTFEIENGTNLGQIGTVMIPEHKLLEWNGEKYEEYKLITLEVNDEDTTIYAEVN